MHSLQMKVQAFRVFFQHVTQTKRLKSEDHPDISSIAKISRVCARTTVDFILALHAPFVWPPDKERAQRSVKTFLPFCTCSQSKLLPPFGNKYLVHTNGLIKRVANVGLYLKLACFSMMTCNFVAKMVNKKRSITLFFSERSKYKGIVIGISIIL